LITGGAGFIGSHLANYLTKKNYEITICDNLFRGKPDADLDNLLKNDNVKLIICDLTKKEELKKLETDYDYVYHLAAINGTRYFYEIPHLVLKVNILTLINILDWFVDNECKKILFPSSSETYHDTTSITYPTPENIPLTIRDVNNPRNSYTGSKIIGELFCLNYSKIHGFPVSIVRYHNIYGPRMGYEHVIPEIIIKLLKKEDPFKIQGGEQTRSFCYVDDTVEATAMVMESSKTNGEVLNIGNDKEEIAILELLKILLNMFNFQPKIHTLPMPEGSVSRRKPSIEKIKKLIGWEPKVDLKTGLQKTIEWYKKNYKSDVK